jgi:ubiquitin C-terminal hydrolase
LHENESPDKLALTDATHALLRVLWSGRWRSISPRYFVNAVWKHSALFASKKQQDANEFLNFYLGRVDDELKPRKATNSVMVRRNDFWYFHSDSPELETEDTHLPNNITPPQLYYFSDGPVWDRTISGSSV